MSRRPRILPQTSPVTQGSSHDNVNITSDGPHPFGDPQALSEAHSLPDISSLVTSGLTPTAQDWPSFRLGNVFFQAQDHLPNNAAESQQPPSEPSTRKHGPKGQTMSAKSWRPSEGRLKQLYVHDETSIRKLREIVNREFGFTATERQYKAQIKKMNLKRNVKEEDQKAVVRRIIHRTHTVKKTSHVRIRGHKINKGKISRWIKHCATDQPSTWAIPSSPLPSYISIYTSSNCASPKFIQSVLPEYQVRGFQSSPEDKKSTVIQRLLKYARVPMHTIRFPETRAVFNDLQVILSCNPDNSTKRHGDTWNPTVEEDIVRVRNLMNMIQELVLNKRLAVSNRSSGRVSIEDIADTSFSGFAGRVAITPIDATLPSFRVIFDFTSHLNLSANISYQAIIPSDSEVFNIVASGQVKELIKAIENGTASLTDRDEQGRSLLNFAFHSARADMCKFLVDEKADVDAIEPARFVDSVGPIHGFLVELDSYIADEERSRIAECLKIMLEAGADTSIEKHFLDGTCFNVFMDAVRSRSVTTFKLILDIGEPFISINSMYNFGSGEESTALIRLAALSGYDDAHSVDIIDKAILLLQRGADISCCRKNGDTVLHTLLKCRRFHELLSKAQARSSWRYLEMWSLSFRAPKELLIVFITAGADVYATNDTGQTPTMLASIGRRDEEWTEALKFCGFDTEQVLAHSTRGLHHCSCQRQTSKLFFEEYCLHRKDNVRFEEASKLSFEEYCLQKKQNLQFEEIETDNEDGGSDGADEEIQKSGGGGYRYFQQCFERTELFDNGTEFCDANSESDQRTNLDVEEAGYSGGDEFTENVADHDSGTENLELTDFAFDLSVGNEEDDVEDFFDFGKYLNAFL